MSCRLLRRISDAGFATAFLAASLTVPRAADAHLSLIRQGAESRGTIETGDRFGSALATGDFDGDGFDDLATGSPEEDIGSVADAGAVIISFGSRFGITHVGADLITADLIGQTSLAGAKLGSALASGDFNHDGYADLAIGAPGEEVSGVSSAGRVYVLRGTASGLSHTPAILLTEASGGGSIETSDLFGSSLAAGNFNGDAVPYADLAVGAPGEDASAGAVFFFLGGASGIATAGSGFFKQTDLGGTNLSGDQFGFALAAGNLVGNAQEDLAVSAPYRDVGGQANAGKVYIIQGSPTGLTSAGTSKFDASFKGTLEANGFFGFALAAGQLYSGAYEGLAIGEPGRTMSGLADAGRVVVGKGDVAALDFSGSNGIELDEECGLGKIGQGSNFGAAIAAGNYATPNAYEDLVIGAPGDTFNTQVQAGFLQVYLGGSSGPIGCALSDDQKRFGETPETGDGFGFAVAFGKFDDTENGNVAAGAPGEDGASGIVHVIASWRQVWKLSCVRSVVYDCENNLIFSQKPFDQVKIASTTKVMTVLIACERSQLPPGDPKRVPLTTNYVVPDWVNDDIPGSQFHFGRFERMNLGDLMYACIFPSGNDAAFAIADLLWGTGDPAVTVPAFVNEMNQRAAQIGMTGTHFHNPAGLDNEPIPPEMGEHYSTPVDMAKLCRVAMQNPLFAKIVGETEHDFVRHLMLGPNSVDVNWKLNNIFAGVLQNMIQPMNGIKGGSTTGAQATGEFSGVNPNSSAPAIVGTYTTPFTVSDQTYTPDAANLMALGLGECDPDVFYRVPTQPPGYVFYVPSLATVHGARGGGSAEFAYRDDGDMTIDLFGPTNGAAAACSLKVSRTSETLLNPGASVGYGIAPFHAHEGIGIQNMGTASTTIDVITPNAGTSTHVIPPGDWVRIPAYGSFLTGFTMTLVNRDPTGAPSHLSVEEVYDFLADLPAGGVGTPRFSALLQRNGDIVGDGLEIYAIGRDPIPGSQITAAAHVSSVVVDVGEPSSRAAPAPVRIFPATPNPFAEETRVDFELGVPGRIEVAIFDAAGRRVRSFRPLPMAAGRWAVRWDGLTESGSRAPGGVYFLRFVRDGVPAGEKKLVRLR